MPRKSAGIKDIARALGVSIGTVDRVLHDRPGVSEKTKSKVLQVAQQLGYQPNLAARALKLNREISIAAVLPKEIAHFFDPLRAGIRAAANATVGASIKLDFCDYLRLGSGDLEAFERAAQNRYDGIILLPSNTRVYAPAINKVSAAGTAVMCVVSDAPSTDRVGSVMTHAEVSGGIAAELLSHNLIRKGAVAVFTGELTTFDHAEKLRGFAATLAVNCPHLTLLPAFESHERAQDAYRQALELLRNGSRPDGVYINTANSIPVLRAMDELNLFGKIKVVTTDLFRELIPMIESGKVLATLYQRPYTQGRLAFERLLNYLLRERKPQPGIRLAPHVVLRSNLRLFSGQLTDNFDAVRIEAIEE